MNFIVKTDVVLYNCDIARTNKSYLFPQIIYKNEANEFNRLKQL